MTGARFYDLEDHPRETRALTGVELVLEVRDGLQKLGAGLR